MAGSDRIEGGGDRDGGAAIRAEKLGKQFRGEAVDILGAYH